MGKPYRYEDEQDSENIREEERRKDKERRNQRGKRRIVFDKPRPGNNKPKDKDSQEYTY